VGGTYNNHGAEEKCLVLVGQTAVVRTNILSIQEYVGENTVLDLMDMVWAYGDVD